MGYIHFDFIYNVLKLESLYNRTLIVPLVYLFYLFNDISRKHKVYKYNIILLLYYI